MNKLSINITTLIIGLTFTFVAVQEMFESINHGNINEAVTGCILIAGVLLCIVAAVNITKGS